MPYPGGNIIRVTPTVVAGETANLDVMFDAAEIPNAVSNRGGVSRLRAITLIEKKRESVAMNIIFMQVQTNFGTADSASSITDANLQAAKVIGAVDWQHTDGQVVFAQDSGEASIATSAGPTDSNSWNSLPMLLKAEEGSTSVFFTAIVNDSSNADYTATDDLEFVFHIEYLD